MKFKNNFKIVICMAVIAMQIVFISQCKKSGNTSQETGQETSQDKSKFMAYVKYDSVLPDGRLRFLIDDVLMVSGDDTAALKKYGIDPNDVNNDYAMYNEKEEWLPYTTPRDHETTFIIIYFDENSKMERRKLDSKEFIKHVQSRESGILATVTVKEGYLVSIEEYYVP
jgi:hypothetical protein